MCEAAEEIKNDTAKEDTEERVNVCKAIEGIRIDGWIEGFVEGFAKTRAERLAEGDSERLAIEKGIKEGMEEVIEQMSKSGMTEKQIKQILES